MSSIGWPDNSSRHAPASLYKLISAASTNGSLVIAGAHVIVGYFIGNDNSAARYVKLYDKATAPTVGTNTPVATLRIPGASSANITFVHPLQFLLGIGVGTTTGPADSDTGAVAANEITVNIWYI